MSVLVSSNLLVVQASPGEPKYQETVRIDAPPEAVAKPITKRPPKPESEWRYLKEKPR